MNKKLLKIGILALTLTCTTIFSQDQPTSEENLSDFNFSNSQDTNTDEQHIELVIPDVAFEECLIALGYDTNGLTGTIYEEDAKDIKSLDLSSPLKNSNLYNVNSKIKSLEGIENFINLTELNCSENNIKALDLSNNLKLKILDCSKNKLTDLDVSLNVNLIELTCNNNKIERLFLGLNDKLEKIYCHDNKLTELDISNCSNITTLDSNNNKKLKKIVFYDSIDQETLDNWIKDPVTIFQPSEIDKAKEIEPINQVEDKKIKSKSSKDIAVTESAFNEITTYLNDKIKDLQVKHKFSKIELISLIKKYCQDNSN